ncbi:MULTISPECIES: flavin reductase family protein [unclassified Mesorhizobium]|uniref:flavin reductase family protein n=1 Tax=unclassified Mesorhizobium TaxID=325217 RepID=UPI001FE1FE8B|nr:MULTISPECIES: flavin reductase family protein [unclassified Mesorhizobium]MCT2580247.1 flavin reductase family protein [Mesorhizobium sp. P13.3]MDF3186104.1 flavin reductase family protein [Mesorhizobium sp. ICCV3110.1]
MLPNHQSIAPSVLNFGTPVVLMVTRNDDGRVGLGFMRGPRLEFGDPGRHQSSAGWRMHPQFSRGQPLGECRTDRAHHGCESVPPHKAELGFVHEADKFALGGFAIQPSELILTPRIAECPLQFETRLLTCHRSAKQQGASSTHLIMEVDVQRVHAHSSIVLPGTNHIDTARWNPLFYVFRHYFGDAVDLGKTFRAEH